MLGWGGVVVVHTLRTTSLQQGLANYGRAGHHLSYIVVLEHSYICLFTYCLWLLPSYSGRVE